MRTVAILTLLTAFLICAQTLPATPVQHIQAELTSTLKLAKAKVGDTLKAQTVSPVTLPDGAAVPAGSTLLGQIRQLDAGSVTVAFSQVVVDKKQIPLKITLVAAALMGRPKTKMSEGNGSARMDSPSPSDHALNGSRYSVTEAGSKAATGVSHESLSEVNADTSSPIVTRGADLPAHAGSVIGMPGVSLTVDDGPPFNSRFQLTGSDLQLPKGVQFMFSIR